MTGSPPTEGRSRWALRRYRPSDERALRQLHHAAVHRSAAEAYPREVLDAWSPEVSDVVPGTARAHTWIAAIDDHPVGFATLRPQLGTIVAVYVHPEFGRRGIASALLSQLEADAAALGIAELSLDASLNAEAFYASRGYVAGPRAVHHLRSGAAIACVPMRKRL